MYILRKLDDGLEGRHNWFEKSMIGAGRGPIMASVLAAEDVVRRIAVECAYVDEQGGVGIRLEPAAAIVRQYGEQFRRETRPEGTGNLPKPSRLLWACAMVLFYRNCAEGWSSEKGVQGITQCRPSPRKRNGCGG